MGIFAGALIFVYVFGTALIAGTAGVAKLGASIAEPGVEMPAPDENRDNDAFIEEPNSSISEPEIR